MTLYAPQPAPFRCIVCGADRPLKWTAPDHIDYPPLCWSCEQYGWRQGAVNRNPDQRLIKQIAVLAEVLATEANARIYGGRWHG